MDANEIERRAMGDSGMPEDVTLPELCYYRTMCSLWQQYRDGRISRDTAAKEKRKVLRLFRETDALCKASLAAYREQQQHIRSIGTLRTELHAAGTVKEKLRIALRMLSLMTGEDVTERVERREAEERT